MKITKIEAVQIGTRRNYGYVSGHVILKIHTDDGPVGLGEASDSRAEDLAAVVRQCDGILVGWDPTRIHEINERLRACDFKSTVSNDHMVAAVDLALYDLNGKALGVPAYRLMGGKFRDRFYCCYPIFGGHVRQDFEACAGYLQRLVDHGHHLFRYYVSGDRALDDRFLTRMKARFGDQIRLKQLDLSGLFTDWETALRYAEGLRRHEPYHFEQPSRDLRICAEFTRRVDLPVSLHISRLQQGLEAIERGACTAFNLACVSCGPTYIRRLYALAESAGIKCLIGTDQESTLGMAGQFHLGASVPNLDLPCDPMGPVLYLDSPAKEDIRAEGSYLFLPEGPGLGVELDDEKMARLTEASATAVAV